MSRCEELIAMSRVVPLLAQSQTASITIDGVTYKVPLIDAAGRLYTNIYATGASEVKSALKATVDPSTTRVTVATPTSGKKIRIISCHITNSGTVLTRFEVYFGTAPNMGASPGKVILGVHVDGAVQRAFGMSWPDGGGPVGAIGDVVSLRTMPNITTDGMVIIHYREE